MFIWSGRVWVVLFFTINSAQSQYDFSETQSLWNLTMKATSLTSNIAQNSLKITSKLLNAAVGSSVRDFMIFLKIRAKYPPELSGAEMDFDDGSRLKVSTGVMILGDKFKVRIEAANIFGVTVRCSGMPVKITYKNYTFSDSSGVISEGYVTGSISKLDISYNLVFSSPNCPLNLDSITVNSIGYPKVQVNSKQTFISPLLRSYLRKLPKKWEEDIPVSLKKHLRLNPFGRAILTCRESSSSYPDAQ